MWQGLLGVLVYEAFPGQLPPPGLEPLELGLWEGARMQGAGLQLSPREPPTQGRLFIITKLSAKPRAGATHEPGMSLWSTHPTLG